MINSATNPAHEAIMKKYLTLILFLFCAAFQVNVLAHLPVATNKNTAMSLAPMLSDITPSIVNITVEKTVSFGDLPISKHDLDKLPTKIVGVGSGVIFNAKQGLIVTNAHVIKDAKIILVTLKDGRRFRGKLMGKDDGFDIAIISIPAKNLSEIIFGNSDQLKVGDFVATIGSPFGLTQTVTSGVISALNRNEPKIEGFQSFIQTDAPINPGNSGGALVNLQGELVGINTAIFTPNDANVGIGFAIPSNMVHSVLEQLIKYGKVKRGMLGVVAQNITPDLAAAFNIKEKNITIVTQVVPGSPADHAGIKVEDIIADVNDHPIHTATQMHNMLGLMRPGTKIKIHVIRQHKLLTLTAEVIDPQTLSVQHAIPFLTGIEMRDFSQLEKNGDMLTGVLVTDLSETGNAALAGLQPGDVITKANGMLVKDLAGLKYIAEKSKEQLLIKVVRNTMALFLVIQRQDEK